MGEREGYTTWEFPVKKALKIFLIIFLVGFSTGYVGTRAFNLDYLLLQLHFQNLWLIIPEGVIILSTLYLWNWSRQSQKKKTRKQAAEQLGKLIREAGGEKKK